MIHVSKEKNEGIKAVALKYAGWQMAGNIMFLILAIQNCMHRENLLGAGLIVSAGILYNLLITAKLQKKLDEETL